MAEDLGQKVIFRYRSGWIMAYLLYLSLFSIIWNVFVFAIKGYSVTPVPQIFVVVGPVLLLLTTIFVVRVLCERVEISGDTIKWFNWIGMEKIHVRAIEVLRLEEMVQSYGRDRYIYPIYVLTTKGEFKFWSGISRGDELISYLRQCLDKRIEMNL